MESKDLVYYIAELILQKKGTDVRIINLEGKTAVTDYFLICSASSTLMVKAIADHVLKETKKIDERVWRDEGYTGLTWVLLDYVDVVVHIFNEETRRFYNLEGLWGDAEIIDVPENYKFKKKPGKKTEKERVMSLPKIAITCGDPNGIGPEIALKIINDEKLMSVYDLKIIIPESVIDYYSKLLKIKRPENQSFINIPDFNIRVKEGSIDKKAGRIASDSIRIAAELCMRKTFDAMVTLPISKKSFNLAGFNFPGHTEYLKAITGCDRTIMVMYSEQLTITPVTIHVPLKKVSCTLEKSVLRKNLLLLQKSLRYNFKIENPENRSFSNESS